VSTLFDLIALGVLGFLQWYSGEVLTGDLLLFFIKQFVMYLLLQLIMYMLPFLQKIVNVVWFPFRALHVFLHIQAARDIYREVEEQYEDEEDLDNLYDMSRIRSGLATGLGRPDENSITVLSFNRVAYAKRIAFAPSRFGWVMFMGYLVVVPLALVSDTFTTTAGALLHFYFFVGIFGVMMPSISDWYFVIHTIMLNLNLRSVYLFNAVLVHVVFTIDAFWRFQDFFLAVIVGTLMFFLYLIGLFTTAVLAQRSQVRLGDIFVLPFRSSKEMTPTVSDLEFFELEDND
jgi:hypothetical protein